MLNQKKTLVEAIRSDLTAFSEAETGPFDGKYDPKEYSADATGVEKNIRQMQQYAKDTASYFETLADAGIDADGMWVKDTINNALTVAGNFGNFFARPADLDRVHSTATQLLALAYPTEDKLYHPTVVKFVESAGMDQATLKKVAWNASAMIEWLEEEVERTNRTSFEDEIHTGAIKPITSVGMRDKQRLKPYSSPK